MTTLLFYYLLKSTICLLAFLIVYKLLIAKLTHFTWMRIYLLGTVIMSMIIPLIEIPIQLDLSFKESTAPITDFVLNFDTTAQNNPSTNQAITTHQTTNLGILFLGLLAIYTAGLLYKFFILIKNLKLIVDSIRNNRKEKDGKYWIVDIDGTLPAFSFFNYIFINKNYQNISNEEFDLIKNHEKIHAKQWHSADILIVEILGIVFWFNPLINYLKKSLQEIHEFIVDEKISEHNKLKKVYAQLLLKLVSNSNQYQLVTNFTGKQIKQRITMITKPRTSQIKKLVFALIVPLTVLMLLSFSVSNSSSAKTDSSSIAQANEKQILGEINWIGNKVYTESELNKALNFKGGDYFTKDDLENRFYVSGIHNLYMDNGYLFYNLEYTTSQNNNNTTDLTVSINEGVAAKIGTITVKGNKTVPTKDILDAIIMKEGNLFSKKELVLSIHQIESIKKLNSHEIYPTVSPNLDKIADGFAEVNLLFEVSEISKK